MAGAVPAYDYQLLAQALLANVAANPGVAPAAAAANAGGTAHYSGDHMDIERVESPMKKFLSAGPPTGAAGASAGVFSSPPRRARLNLARNPLGGRKPEGGSHVGAGAPRIPQRISATRRRTPLHRRAMKQHFLYKAVIRGGFVGGGSESTRASPVGFGFRVVASVASLARSLLAGPLVGPIAGPLVGPLAVPLPAKPHKKTDQFH